MSIRLRLNLGGYLQRHGLTAYRLAQAMEGRVSANTIYTLARKPAQRIDLSTVGEALGRLTGEPVSITDMLEEAAPPAPAPSPASLAALRLDPNRPTFDASNLKTLRRHGRPVVPRPGPSAEEVIAQDRGRESR
ncbi:hypothetical protein DAETH_37460 (plasmid) [Deinococcus aetherius]|uniref:HTH cro/C1-type domain-containing protein n=1 Tax=Deinococcus aetherius TaxID=200252 RepID=A0ABM8AJ92_9DEIO|nr:hypothetical protein [Deinococcus aetherius]BDP43777.1 hypothetical protein DAETH_37460 [Deinococcus aetherius]